MPDVFLSYSRDDKGRANQVADALTREGFDVFWDQEIPPGRAWAEYLTEKLTACKAVVVLWSDSSGKSSAVREEARIGLQQKKLIPVMLDRNPPPFGFGEVHALNLADWSGEPHHGQYRLLVSAIGAAAGAPKPQAGQQPQPIYIQQRAEPEKSQASYQPQPIYIPPLAEPEKKKKTSPLVWAAAGGVGVLALLVVLGSMGGGTTPNPPEPAPVFDGGGAAPLPVAPSQPGQKSAGALAPDVAAKVREARETQQEAQVAAQEAATSAVAGRQAAMAAQQGQFGFSTIPLQGGVFAGQIVQLQGGAPAAGALQTQDGVTLAGMFQLNLAQQSMEVRGAGATPAGEASVGRFVWQGANLTGVGNYTGSGVYFEGRTWGAAGSTRSSGLGVVKYQDGSRYEGEILSVGNPAVVQRHGLGALYGPNGELRQHGDFENDRLTQQ